MLAASRMASNNGSNMEKTPSLVAHPFCSLRDHASAFAGAMRHFLLALFCMYVIHGGTDPLHGYPAFGRALSFKYEWTIPIFARNIIGTWLIAGGWDWYVNIIWFLFIIEISKGSSNSSLFVLYAFVLCIPLKKKGFCTFHPGRKHCPSTK